MYQKSILNPRRNTWKNDKYFSLDTPIGVSIRFRHEECDNGRDALIVTRHHNGWFYYCHKCGDRGFKRAEGLAPQVVAQKLRDYKESCAIDKKVISVYNLRLPKDFDLELPLTAKMWLYKYRITDDIIKQFRFGYSDYYKRLIMPYWKQGVLQFWVGRNLNPKGEHSKYLTIKRKDIGTPAYLLNKRSSDTLVITEDIISAINVYRSSAYASLALLGSSYRDYFCSFPDSIRKIILWLDPDKKTETVRIARKIVSLSSCYVKPIFTDKDPKEFDDEEIKEILG